eukprot:Skav222388  [mRNA]  locus=scaffold4422:10427:18639:+ [translate_table: standard]
MGCGASSVAKVMDFDDLSNVGGQAPERQSTLHSWTMAPAPGVPALPPNRQMHEQHVKRMEKFLSAVKAKPLLLRGDVYWRRIIHERLQEQRQENHVAR